MSWSELFDFFLKYFWIPIIIPLFGWLEKKRREYVSLIHKVENLEHKIDTLTEKFDADREERKNTERKIDNLSSKLNEIHIITVANTTRLEERNK